LPAVIEGWDYVQAYNRLAHDLLPALSVVRPIKELSMHSLCKNNELVVSSIPRYHITPKWVKHPFAVVYTSKLPPVGFAPDQRMKGNFVVYNADPEVPWATTSRVVSGGVEYWWTEYVNVPDYRKKDVTIRQTEKVMSGEHFAFPRNLLIVGKRGCWEPGIFAHDAYWETARAMMSRA
jgi:hypothetical protein